MIKDYYYILGIKQNASADEIKRAYRKLSQKLHPDKNDGDDFFTERFKDIQEAYEVLTSQEKRKVFDNSRYGYSYTQKQNKKQYNEPEIEFFNSSRLYFELGQEINFSWKTTNANKVTLKPFGEVTTSGQRTYKISNVETASMSVELIAENVELRKSVSTMLTLMNNSHNANQQRTKEEIERATKQLLEDEKYNKQVHRIVKIVFIAIAIFTLFRVIQMALR